MAACEYIINDTFGIGLGAWGAADGSLLEIKPLSPRLPGTSEAALYFGGSCFWVGGLLVPPGTGCQVATLLRRVCPGCRGAGFSGAVCIGSGTCCADTPLGWKLQWTGGMLDHDSPTMVLHFAAVFFIMFIMSYYFPVDRVPRCNCSASSLSKQI